MRPSAAYVPIYRGRTGPANVLRLMFDPGGLRPYVLNWDEVAPALIQRAHREVVGGFPDEQTQALLDDVLSMPTFRHCE